jgi:SNF2 family DNA or RNA helicase
MINPLFVEQYLNRHLFDSQEYKNQSEAVINGEIAKLSPFHPIYNKLKHHQKVGLLLNIDRKFFLDLFEMGLGKSLTSLACVKYLKDNWLITKTLVLVPNTSLLYSWKDQIEEHIPELTYVILDEGKQDRESKILNSKADITICTYASWMRVVCNFVEVIKYSEAGKKKKEKKLKIVDKQAFKFESQFQCVVLDELTAAKGYRSNTHKMCCRFQKTAAYRLGLAGRAYGTDQHDLWGLFNVIDGGETFGDTLGMFRSAFFKEKNGFWGGFEYKFIEKLSPVLNKFLRNRAIIYKKEECLDLPPKVYSVQRVVHSEEMVKRYNKVISDVIGLADQADVLDGAWHNLRQICSGWMKVTGEDEIAHNIEFDENPKLDALMEFIKEMDPKEKIIIFHWYNHTGTILSNCFTKNKIKHACLFGGNKDKDAVEKFNNDPNCRIFLASSAGALGLNLQISHYVLFFEEPCNPLLYDQMTSRAHRQGQLSSVFIYNFMVKNSVEEKIHKNLISGEDLYEKIMKTPESIFTKLG